MFRKAQNPAAYVGGILLIAWIAYLLYYLIQPPSVIQKDLYNITPTQTSQKVITNTNHTVSQSYASTNIYTTQWSGIVYTSNCIEIKNLPLYASKASFELDLGKVNNTITFQQNKTSINYRIEKIAELDNVKLEYSFLGKKSVTLENPENDYLSLEGVKGYVIVKVNNRVIYEGDSDTTIPVSKGKITIETKPPSLPFEISKAYIEKVILYKKIVETKTNTNQNSLPIGKTLVFYYDPTLGKPYLVGDDCLVSINGIEYATYGNKIPVNLKIGVNKINVIKSENCKLYFERSDKSLDFNVSKFGNVSITIDLQGKIYLCKNNVSCIVVDYNIKNLRYENVTNIKIIPIADSYIYYMEICKS